LTQEDGAVAEPCQGAEEGEFVGVKSFLEGIEEEPAKETTQYSDRQEEVAPAGDPSGAVGREPATGDDAMQVRMMAPTPTIP
jgi:hypothetical protein